MKKFDFFKHLAVVAYVGLSVPVFNKIYETTKQVIDEEFHIRQGTNYCSGNFSAWDPKITTLPGLYLISALLFLPFKACSIYNLRLTSLLASILNVFLIYEIRAEVLQRHTSKKLRSTWQNALEALTISLLPPMYFFSFLYYTDIVSVTATLGMIYLSVKRKHNLAALVGVISVNIRQTNIIWVGAVFLTNVIDRIVIKVRKKKWKKYLNNSYGFKDIWETFKFHLIKPQNIPDALTLIFKEFIGYILVMISFLLFLFINGSIVIGDKTAHQAALHLPQIGYYALFSIIFGSSVMLTNVDRICQTIYKKWYLTLGLAILFTFAAKYNTIVHPYLLADNRHYTFYIWNRFYGKYYLARFIIIPAYIFGIIGLWKGLEKQPASFKLCYIFGTFASIALQQMIEVRYFIIPFLIWRLNFAEIVQKRFLVWEFLIYISLNIITLYLFFKKEIIWSNYSHAQRIIW